MKEPCVPKWSFAFHGLKWNWQLCAFLWKHRLHQAFYRHAAGCADAHVDGPTLRLVANGELRQPHAFACHGGDESHHVVDRCEVALGDWCHGSTVPAQISHDEVGAWDFVCGSHFFLSFSLLYCKVTNAMCYKSAQYIKITLIWGFLPCFAIFFLKKCVFS